MAVNSISTTPAGACWTAYPYASWLADTRAALRARLADAPGGPALREYFERGKMLRAYLVFAATEAVGGLPDAALTAAEAIELLHAASLFHDDVIDEAPIRRGFPSLQRRLGVGPALILGDELILRALGAVAEMHVRHPPARVLRAVSELTRLVRDCCRGQFDELEAAPWISQECYLAIVAGKTGAPFEAAAMLGAVFGGGADHQITRLQLFASRLGVAFQIADDLQDLVGVPEDLGKPVGNSLMNERPLLPLLLLWRDGGDSVRAQLTDLRNQGWPRRQVVDLLERRHALASARRLSASILDEAIASLGGLPGARGVEALHRLAAAVAARSTAPARDAR